MSVIYTSELSSAGQPPLSFTERRLVDQRPSTVYNASIEVMRTQPLPLTYVAMLEHFPGYAKAYYNDAPCINTTCYHPSTLCGPSDHSDWEARQGNILLRSTLTGEDR